MSRDCNLKIHNALRRTFREQNRLRPLPCLENRETWGIQFGENELLL